jgi:hypothetical protein
MRPHLTTLILAIALVSLPATAPAAPPSSYPLTPAGFSLRAITSTPDGGFAFATNHVTRVSASGEPTQVGKVVSPEIADIAALPDGGFLVADGSSRILRLSPSGAITRIAGQTRRNGDGGDGGPATSASLTLPKGVAVAADGSVLIADAGNNRVRRIAPDGTITTVAGIGKPGFSGDGGPAVAAALNEPVDVVPTPDGGFLIADDGNGLVRAVTATGTIETVVGNRTTAREPKPGRQSTTVRFAGIDGIGRAPDGSLLVDTRFTGVWRVADGLLVKREDFDGPFAIEPDGGVLFGTSDGVIRWIPGTAPARAAVAIDRATRRLGTVTTARFHSTQPGTARIVVRRGTREVLVHEAPAAAGENAISLPGTLVGGRAYKLELTVTTADGKRATGALGFVPSGALPVSLARDLARIVSEGEGDVEYSENVRKCKRVSATRVDCSVSSSTSEGNVKCDHVNAFFLPPSGEIYYRPYACPFQRKPRLGRRVVAPEY